MHGVPPLAEGYTLYRPELARAAMRAAKARGALVSLDLASFEVVRNCRQGLTVVHFSAQPQPLLSLKPLNMTICLPKSASMELKIGRVYAFSST